MSRGKDNLVSIKDNKHGGGIEKKEKVKEEQEDITVEQKKDGAVASLTFDSDTFGSISIQLNKFVPGTAPEINLFATITVYGKRKSGKSVFCKWMIQAFKHEIPWGWVFTTTKFNLFYKSFIPDKFILTKFRSEDLFKIMERQKKAIMLHAKQVNLKYPERDRINPRAVVIWDDYAGNDIKFNKGLHMYYLTGRHYFTMNFFMTQYVKETPPAIRTNTDYAILFNSDNYPSMEVYAEEFCGKMKKRDFISMYEYATREKHSFLCINNDPNCPMEKKYFVGKAKVLPADINYIIGCQDYWRDNMKQLQDILSGKMEEEIELKAEMNEHHDNNKFNYKDHHIKDLYQMEKICQEHSQMAKFPLDQIQEEGPITPGLYQQVTGMIP